MPDNPANHGEGAFYVWTAAEIAAALGTEAAPLFSFRYGIEPHGNVSAASDPHGEFQGKNILFQRHSLEDAARKFGHSPKTARAMLAAARQSLLTLRTQRPRPHKDDKILTAWNGLALSAFARAARIFGEPRYRQAAQNAAHFIKSALYDASSGRLLRRYRDGDAAIDGLADDYAFLIQGLLDLYDCDFETAWLDWALALQKTMDARFADENGGGYYGAHAEAADLLVRDKEWRDGAEPSPNSAAAGNLLRLARLTGQSVFTERVERLFQAFGAHMRAAPQAMPLMLAAVGLHLEPPRHIVVAGQPDAADTLAMLRAAQAGFAPNRTVLFMPGGDAAGALARHAPWLRDCTMRNGQATAYACDNFVCRLPVTDPNALADRP